MTRASWPGEAQAGGSQKVAANGSPTDGAKKVSAKNVSEPRTPAHICEELLPQLARNLPLGSIERPGAGPLLSSAAAPWRR